jgi:tRNA-Thr(GGU) m(6)t(6)A37 methyltransferase TsaA
MMCSAYYMTDDNLASEQEPSPVSNRISFRRIGSIEAEEKAQFKPVLAARHQSRIVLDPEFTDGLEGLQPGDRLLVVYQFHLSRSYALLQHPKRDATRPKRGVFALRSPHRPNPIGVTIVKILGISDNVLRVKGLDAWDGSPVLDLKPAHTEEL